MIGTWGRRCLLCETRWHYTCDREQRENFEEVPELICPACESSNTSLVPVAPLVMNNSYPDGLRGNKGDWKDLKESRVLKQISVDPNKSREERAGAKKAAAELLRLK